MMQVMEQTHEERVKMYMRCTKREMAEMLANRDILDDAYKPEPLEWQEGTLDDPWRITTTPRWIVT